MLQMVSTVFVNVGPKFARKFNRMDDKDELDYMNFDMVNLMY